MEKKRNRGSKKWAATIAIVTIVVVILGGFSFLLYNKKRQTLESNIRAMKTYGLKKNGGQKSTEYYNKELKQEGAQKAAIAEKKGKSYITPVIQHNESHDTLSSLLASPKTKVVKSNNSYIKKSSQIKVFAKPKTLKKTVQPSVLTKKEEDTLTNAVRTEMAKIITNANYANAEVITYQPIEEIKQKKPAIIQKKMSSMEIKKQDINLKKFHPGSVYYAINEQLISSDALPPVEVAKILSGPFKGSRVFGKIKKQKESLILSYSRLVTKDDKEYKITGFAVDPTTQSAGLASSVDHHYLSRWGGVIAASFLTGFSDAVKNSGISTYNNSTSYDSPIVSTPNYSTNDELWIAGGEVGKRLSKQMDKNFNTPVTVTLEKGMPMGILLISMDAP